MHVTYMHMCMYTMYMVVLERPDHMYETSAGQISRSYRYFTKEQSVVRRMSVIKVTVPERT